MSPTQYALRMDYAESDQSGLTAYLSKYATKYFVVYESHDGENPHVHAMFDSGKKENALRVAFKRQFPDKIGNGAYSLKECDDDIDAYMRYMCKGDSVDNMPVVLIRQGLEFTDEKIAEYHQQYWVNNAALTGNKRKRVALKESGTVVEKLEKLCKEQGVRKSERERIAELYIKMYRDARKPINVFAARAVVNTVQCLLDDSDEIVKSLAQQIAN